jgi:prophage tail gpP-like protein
VKLEVNGKHFTDWVSANAELRLDVLSNTFSFESINKGDTSFPVKQGDQVKIYVDDVLVLTGYVEVVTGGGDATNRRFSVTGRDKTGDFLDSSVDTVEMGEEFTLKQLIEATVKNVNPDTAAKKRIQVIDLVQAEPFNSAEDLASADPGQNAFDFVEKFARKRQVLLTSNADGNIVIARSTPTESGAYLRHHGGEDPTNNVLRYSVSYDSTGRYNLYRSVSQPNGSLLNVPGLTSTETVVGDDVPADVIDNEIRKGRQFILVSEGAGSVSENQKRIDWQRNIDRARGRTYSATVHGFRNVLGDIYKLNTLIHVHDSFAAIDTRMLISGLTFQMLPSGGRETVITTVERDAFNLAAREPVKTETETGGGLVL